MWRSKGIVCSAPPEDAVHAGGQEAIDDEGGTGQEARRVRGEEQRGGRCLVC
jgi:hypothetical protein